MSIENVYYFNEIGERGYMGTEDDPFGKMDKSSKLAYSLLIVIMALVGNIVMMMRSSSLSFSILMSDVGLQLM